MCLFRRYGYLGRQNEAMENVPMCRFHSPGLVSMKMKWDWSWWRVFWQLTCTHTQKVILKRRICFECGACMWQYHFSFFTYKPFHTFTSNSVAFMIISVGLGFSQRHCNQSLCEHETHGNNSEFVDLVCMRVCVCVYVICLPCVYSFI